MPLFDGTGTLFWNLDGIGGPLSRANASGTTTLSVALVMRQSRGWFSLGFPPDKFLPGFGHMDTDMIVAQVDGANSSVVLLSDRWSTNNTLPPLDSSLGGQDNLIFPQGIVTPAGQMYIKFRRLYSTGDKVGCGWPCVRTVGLRARIARQFDRVVNVTATQPCLFAFFDGSNNFSYHGRANVQLGVCNFGNVTERAAVVNPFPRNLVIAHGVLGALGVGLFMTVGAFWLRFFGAKLAIVSSVLFLLGVALIIISFIIAGVMVSQGSGIHYNFNSPSSGSHSILALVTMMCAVSFLLVRFFVDCVLRPSRARVAPTSEKGQFYTLGQYAGYTVLALTILVGWPTIFLGFVDDKNRDPWLWVIGGILIGFAAIWLVAEVVAAIVAARSRKTGRKSVRDDGPVEMGVAAPSATAEKGKEEK